MRLKELQACIQGPAHPVQTGAGIAEIRRVHSRRRPAGHRRVPWISVGLSHKAFTLKGLTATEQGPSEEDLIAGLFQKEPGLLRQGIPFRSLCAGPPMARLAQLGK